MEEKKVRITHYHQDPTNGPGQMVTRPYNLAGDPFVVFCTNKDCSHYIEADGAIPWWSEDLSDHLGVLRCRKCQAPVVRPRTDY